jgi:polyferredoxin
MVKKHRLQGWIHRILPQRIWVQTAFLMVWLDPLGIRAHGFCSPVFHCYACPLATFACPIGVMAQFSALHIFPFAVVGLLLVAGGLLGSLLCGWACPFGWLQDLAAKTPFGKYPIPRVLGYGRYVMLAGATLLIPWFWGEHHPLFVCKICPAGALEKAVPDMLSAAFSGGAIPWPNALKLGVLLSFVVAAFVTIRPWCRVLCPLGGFFGLMNKFSVVSMDLDDHRCTHCGQCRTLCRYGIAPDEGENALDCLRCLECTRCGRGALQTGP